MDVIEKNYITDGYSISLPHSAYKAGEVSFNFMNVRRIEITTNENQLRVISLGATQVHPWVTVACLTINQLHEFFSDQMTSNVIFTHSSDTLSWKELHETCVVYNV